MGARWTRLIAVACLLALVAACGSTTKKNSSIASPGATDAANSAPDPSGTPGPSASAAAGTGTVPGSGTGTSTTGSISTEGKDVFGAKGVAGPATGSKVQVGLQYTKDLGGVLGAFGAVDSTDGPAEDVISKLTKWINANGGLGGHVLDPVMHGSDVLANSFSAQAQQACSDFTEDHHVSFVVSGASAMPLDLADCLMKRHVPLMWEQVLTFSKAEYARYKNYLYQPFNMSDERQISYIDQLIANNWATKSSKIGFVYMDNATHITYKAKTIVPGLAKHGMKITAEGKVSDVKSSGDAGALASQLSNVVVRFNAAGIDHVLFAPTGGSIPFVFMQQAANQKYYPRYGFNSLDIPAFIDLNAPDDQALEGALAFGWMPTSDVLTPQRPKDNPAERLCLKITNNRSDIASRYCEGMFFLKTMFDAGATTSPTQFAATLKKVGKTFDSPWTPHTDFTSGRIDGAAVGRMAKWGGACKCFSYYGPFTTVP